MPEEKEITDTTPLDTPKAEETEISADDLDRVPSGGSHQIIEKVP